VFTVGIVKVGCGIGIISGVESGGRPVLSSIITGSSGGPMTITAFAVEHKINRHIPQSINAFFMANSPSKYHNKYIYSTAIESRSESPDILL